MAFTVGDRTSAVAVLLIYRPGSQLVTDLFYKELANHLETLALYKCQIILAGDLNIRLERDDDGDAIRLLDLLASFDCIQHIKQPTHTRGGTLDHVFTRREDTVIDLRVDPAGVISDHSLITWRLKFTIMPPITSQKTIRNWKKVDRSAFRQALQNSALCEDIPDGVGPDSLFETYEAVLRKLADKFAPSRKVTIRRQPIAVWYDDESRLLRRRSRTLEKRYRRSGLASDRLEWVRHERERHRINRIKENGYWMLAVAENAGHPRKLWKTLVVILGFDRVGNTSTSGPTSQNLLDYFIKKINDIRQSTGNSPPSTKLPPSTAVFERFKLYSPEEIRKQIQSTKSKSCSLDPIPTTILKEFSEELLPFVTEMCNRSARSLQQGWLPISQRHAIVKLIIKKEGLDQDDVKHYRPIPNLTYMYMSKLVERM